ncbi:mannitol-1-phosphate 5-dehydrogenase [Paenibacillus sp. YN15]|uniref:mannitol-1-phosphate 5-dehydrogenase n=1 Tax=Paenibacillus sp. YN15 TaxID=1742774 RepID=UPI000DCB1A69|nr:mannitol-1-phosphate 5-dehydrogenase [Paenibacillus sp. YN15]RAV01475.1 mannitol-1-phosphate 5-dehydrogenase [Paenibacillus sp. YN15]
MKAVQFGAGNIGRGFIGMQLSGSGYEVCFVARNERQIALLQKRRQYTVMLAGAAGGEDVSVVRNVTALRISDAEAVARQVAEAELVTTAVGAGSLKAIAGALARGIELRLRQNPRILHVIACENTLRGSSQLKKWVYAQLDPSLHKLAEKWIYFPDSIVDRIVPVQQQEDPLAVKVEPFFEWVIDKRGIAAGFPAIQGVILADELEAYMERKLFTVNTGHCSAAYFGYLAGCLTIQEAMKKPLIKIKVRRVMQETGRVLVQKYGLDEKAHVAYIERTLERFANPGLTDRIERVARSPLSKLSYNNRLVRPAMLASRLGLPVSNLADAIAAALRFDSSNDEDAARVQTVIRQKGIQSALGELTGIPFRHPLHGEIVRRYNKLNERYPLEIRKFML